MKKILIWIARLTVAIILLQTLFFKFTASDESVYIFTKLGAEPYGRIGSGIIELFAAVLVLIPRTTIIGALLGLATMLGAITSHLFVLGIEVKNDGGQLFIMALVTLFCCIFLVFQDRQKLPLLIKFKI